MNIMYLCFDPGIPVLGEKGASVHVREMIASLERADHTVTLVCTKLGAGNPQLPGNVIALEPRGDDIRAKNDPLRVERARIAYDRDLALRVVEALQRAGVQPDACYERFALFSRAGAEVAAHYGIPRILEVNAPLVEEQERYRDLQLKDAALAFERAAFLSADRIVAVSDAVAAYVVERGVDAARVVVLPNGVDLARFNPRVPSGEVRERHGLAERPVIGFVGSLKPWHGVHEFLDVFTEIHSIIPSVALLIVGEGPGFIALRETIAKRDLGNDVIATGRVAHDDVPAYLCAMDMTVAPYRRSEDFYFSPLKVVESLACGRPVVAPALGQLPDLISDGITGRLYPPDDDPALCATVVEMLRDDDGRRAMGTAAAAYAQTYCSWSVHARHVEQMIRAAARTPRTLGAATPSR